MAGPTCSNILRAETARVGQSTAAIAASPDGLTGNGDMVVSDQIRNQIAALVADATVADVPGTNHHTILVSRPGARPVAAAMSGFLR